MTSLARDNGIAVSTAFDYRDEGIAVLAARRPTLHGRRWRPRPPVTRMSS